MNKLLTQYLADKENYTPGNMGILVDQNNFKKSLFSISLKQF